MFGLFNPLHKKYTGSQATLVIIANVLGLAFIVLPYVIGAIFRLHISLALLTCWWTFVVGHCMGETFEFYYRLVGWDKGLHLVSGVLTFVSFYAMARSYFAAKGYDGGFAPSFAFAITASLAIGCVWETIEFTIDSLFGTNMQKFIPEQFFNGGNAFAPLEGAADEIASFYRMPEGYRFALLDSMFDCVNCIAGTALGAVVVGIVASKNRKFLERAFVRIPRREVDVVRCPQERTGVSEK